jgi:hypothetical protein
LEISDILSQLEDGHLISPPRNKRNTMASTALVFDASPSQTLAAQAVLALKSTAIVNQDTMQDMQPEEKQATQTEKQEVVKGQKHDRKGSAGKGSIGPMDKDRMDKDCDGPGCKIAWAVNSRVSKKKVADQKAQARQAKQGAKMHNQFKRSIKTNIGSIVCLRVDIRDRSQCNPSGILAVVFAVKEGTGGIRIVCEHGVIGTGRGGRGQYWAPIGTFVEQSANQTLTAGLEAIRAKVKNGTFIEWDYPHISQRDAQSQSLGHDTNGRHKCRCKKNECGGSCGCRRNGSYCSSSCSCGGSCAYNMAKFQPPFTQK